VLRVHDASREPFRQPQAILPVRKLYQRDFVGIAGDVARYAKWSAMAAASSRSNASRYDSSNARTATAVSLDVIKPLHASDQPNHVRECDVRLHPRNAAAYILAPPNAKQQSPKWQATAEALLPKIADR